MSAYRKGRLYIEWSNTLYSSYWRIDFLPCITFGRDFDDGYRLGFAWLIGSIGFYWDYKNG